LGDPAARAGGHPRLQLRLQGLPAGSAGGDRRVWRAPPLHPRARQPPRFLGWRDPGDPSSAPARRQQVRLGPLLQRAPRPHHRALHHPLHAAALAPLRRFRPALPDRGLRRQRLPGVDLVRRPEPLQPASPPARHPADAARHPGAHHRADRRDDHLQELPPPRQLFDQGMAGVTAGAGLDLLFLTQTYPRFEGDTAGPFIRDLARALVRGGDRVTVLAPHAAGLANGWDDDGVEVVTFRYAPERYEALGYGRTLEADERVKGKAMLAAPLYLLAGCQAIRRLRRERRFDLVHAHWIVPNGVAAAKACGNVPLAIGLHGSDVFLAERRGVRRLARWALSRARLLTGCSPELVERVRALGFPEERLAERSRVIPYGVDVGTFSPAPERRTLWRQRLGIPDGAPLLLGVGRMATKKGFQVLIEILPSLLGEFPDLHVVLAGGGDLLDGFRESARPLGTRVHFPGAVLRDTLPD